MGMSADMERTNRMWAALVARRDAFDGQHSFLGEVPPDRLTHAAQKFLVLEPGERILAFLDETLSGNGKGGIVLTDRAIRTREFGEGTKVQALDQIRSIDVTRLMNTKLMVNGRLLVTSTISQNASAVAAIREAIVEGLGLEAPVATSLPPLPPPAPGPPANWYPDPAGHHEWRYWDGTTWSERVADGGIESTEPVGAPPVPQATVPEASAPEGAVTAQVVSNAKQSSPRAATPPDAPGPVTLHLKQGLWSMPSCCVVCASPDVVAMATYVGETSRRRISLAFPICGDCKAVLDQAGQSLEGPWKLVTFVPKELRPRFKAIRNAVRLTPPSSSFSPVGFRFANGQFGREFADLNP